MRHDQPVGLYQRLAATHRTIVAAALLVGACGTALADELRTPAELQFENSRNAAAANYGKCLSQSKKADYANCDGLRDVYASHFPDIFPARPRTPHTIPRPNQ